MREITAAIIIVGALLAGCATPAPGPTPTATSVHVAAEPSATAPPTATPVPSATPTITPASEGCVRATTEIPEGQNPTHFMTSGPPSGCYETVGAFLDDIGLTWAQFAPGATITFWTQWSVDERGKVVYPTPTPTSIPTPTLVPRQDQDSDGLCNLDEQVKYRTNPYASDSDGDALPDSDWDERREYAYTVHVRMKIRPPFDINAMNDPFQDAKIVSGPDDNGYTHLDVIIYPDTRIPLVPSSYPLRGLSNELLAFTQPGISTNYSQAMQQEVASTVGGSATDKKAVEAILAWTERNTELADLPYQPEVFYYTYIDNAEVRLRNYNGEIPVSEMLEKLFYADSMFRARVHGTCCSTATFKCAMIKAAGIPCKIIQTLFPIFSHQDQEEPYETQLARQWGPGHLEDQPAGQPSEWANHCFLEVYLGGQWVRVDNRVNIYHESQGCLSVKILSVSDLTEVDFSTTYPVDWVHNRPYYTSLVEDQEPRHP